MLVVPESDKIYAQYAALDYDQPLDQTNPFREAVANINRIYLATGCIHVFNALQYAIVWLLLDNPKTGNRFTVFDAVMVPEYLNIIEASIYLLNAQLYNLEVISGPNAYADPWTLRIHKLELGAAGIELFAAFAWVMVWVYTYPRVPGACLCASGQAASLRVCAFGGVLDWGWTGRSVGLCWAAGNAKF